MIVLEIDSVKEFMQHMFQGSMFDRFHLRSCEVTTFATFHIDGRCFDDWFDSDEKRTDETGLVTWNMTKTFVFSWIKEIKCHRRCCLIFVITCQMEMSDRFKSAMKRKNFSL